MSASEHQFLIASLRGYLGELLETGVDEIPLAPVEQCRQHPAATTDDYRSVAVEAANSQLLETIESIRDDLGDCRRCSLGDTRTTLVFGTGNPSARIVFVGEAPGRDEDLQGKPFVGEAGRLLTKIIEAMGFKREDVYICNVLKCRPPNNRNPLPAEIEACHPFLLRQLKAINPEAIVALGTFAAQTLLETREPISRLRGRFHDYHGIPLMATFHPAFLLRNPAMKRDVWNDMKAVLEKLGLKVPAPGQSQGKT